MGGYYININVKSDSTDTVSNAVVATFEGEGFELIQTDKASLVVDNEDLLPDGDNWYGVMIAGRTETDWVTVYLDDWKDCGLLARKITESLQTSAIEVWVADDVNWGYNYWQNGVVGDRFADDPAVLTTDAAEAELYFGNAAVVGPILEVTDETFSKVLVNARNRAGQFAGPCIGDLCEAVALPFEQVFTGYEYFFTDDPDDYSADLPTWSHYVHLAFIHPNDRERLAE